MKRPSYLSVGILLPKEISSLDNDMPRILAGDDSIQPALSDQARSHAVTRIVRAMIKESADDLRLHLQQREYPIFQPYVDPVKLRKVGFFHGGRRAREFCREDIAVIVDPRPEDWVLATSLVNPLRRSIVAFTHLNEGNKNNLFSNQKAMQIGSIRVSPLSIMQASDRIFALHLPLNEGERADAFEENAQKIRSALLYPLPG